MRKIKVYIDNEHALTFQAPPHHDERTLQKEARKILQAVYGPISKDVNIELK